MAEKQPEVGSYVLYITKNPNGAQVLRAGIILGFGNQPDGRNADFPPAHIAYLDPSNRSAVLGGSEWRNAFDRTMDVPHVSCKVEDRHFYRVPENVDEVRSALLGRLDKAEADLNAQAEADLNAQAEADLNALKEAKPAGPQVVAPVLTITPPKK